jgi:hypothetical protein
MNLNNLEKIEDCFDPRFTHEQQVMAEFNMKNGYEVYVEEYQDYCYAVLFKEGVRNGIKRLNRTGHNTYVNKY